MSAALPGSIPSRPVVAPSSDPVATLSTSSTPSRSDHQAEGGRCLHASARSSAGMSPPRVRSRSDTRRRPSSDSKTAASTVTVSLRARIATEDGLGFRPGELNRFHRVIRGTYEIPTASRPSRRLGCVHHDFPPASPRDGEAFPSHVPERPSIPAWP